MTIIGNTDDVAIECRITKAFFRPSFRALGYFRIYVNGQVYGLNAPDATLLACSYDSVKARLVNRGLHIADFANNVDALTLAQSVDRAVYAPDDAYKPLLPISREYLNTCIDESKLLWAPDGDQAFDDGGHVIQLDLNAHRVRLIGFKRSGKFKVDSISESIIDSGKYYSLLNEWIKWFDAEWEDAPKELGP